MKAPGIHLLLAVVWLLLSQEPSPAIFGWGLVFGFLLMALFPGVLDCQDYVRRILAGIRFALVFVFEFFVANVTVAWMVLFRSRESIHPNYLTYDTSELRPGEILLLSYCISLTPGTTTIEISPDFKEITIHALDADDPVTIRQKINQTLETGITAFTR